LQFVNKPIYLSSRDVSPIGYKDVVANYAMKCWRDDRVQFCINLPN